MLGDDLATILAAAGVGVVGSGDYGIFTGILPALPAQAVGILETPGVGPVHTFAGNATRPRVEQVRAQIRVRSMVYSTGRQKVEDACNALDGVREQTVGGTRYLSIFAVQRPFLLERDENGRPTFAFNVDVTKIPS